MMLLLLLASVWTTTIWGAITPHVWDWEDVEVVDPYTRCCKTFMAVAFDSENNVFVGGRSHEGMFAVKLDGVSGTVMWTYLQENNSSSADGLDNDLGSTGTVDAAGNFILVGDFVAKIDGATGEEIWQYKNRSDVVDNQYSFPSWKGTAVDAAGDIYLATHVTDSSYDTSMFAAKLDGDSGEYVWSWGEDTPEKDYLSAVVIDGNNTVLLLGHAKEQFVYDGPFDSIVGVQVQGISCQRYFGV